MTNLNTYKTVSICGAPASGKSTLLNEMAHYIGVSHTVVPIHIEGMKLTMIEENRSGIKIYSTGGVLIFR
ncbi:MAG: hypothetical protein AB1489_28490, partial [Acidobacteriota bacterium]